MNSVLQAQIEALPKAAGTYVLVLRVGQDQTLRVGRLGDCVALAGHYAYVGSARGPGGLAARIGRHLRGEKRLHWHIDYLLPVATIEEIWTDVSERRLECEWAGRLLRSPGAGAAIPRFGASDCHCPAHLIYWETFPPRERLLSVLEIR